MGLVKTSRVRDYWKVGGDCQFAPMNRMGLTRFQQLKGFFHLLTSLPKSAPWYEKVEPFGEALREASRRYLVPATKVSVDKMMIRFTGRSNHTIKIKNNQIGQGYKLFALCWYGYTYSYLYNSQTKIINVKKFSDHSLTSSVVYDGVAGTREREMKTRTQEGN